jgi:hypothetical protein
MRKWISKRVLRKLYDELVIDHSNLLNDYEHSKEAYSLVVKSLEDMASEKEKLKLEVEALKSENDFLRKQQDAKVVNKFQKIKKARAGFYGE